MTPKGAAKARGCCKGCDLNGRSGRGDIDRVGTAGLRPPGAWRGWSPQGVAGVRAVVSWSSRRLPGVPPLRSTAIRARSALNRLTISSLSTSCLAFCGLGAEAAPLALSLPTLAAPSSRGPRFAGPGGDRSGHAPPFRRTLEVHASRFHLSLVPSFSGPRLGLGRLATVAVIDPVGNVSSR